MVLSIEERVLLVEYIFREGNRYTELVQEQFAEKFPQTPVLYHNAVPRLTEKFREKGSVLDAEQSGRPSELNDKTLMGISDSMMRSPSKSLCTATFRKQICRKCLRIKLNGFRPV
jgi:transposase